MNFHKPHFSKKFRLHRVATLRRAIAGTAPCVDDLFNFGICRWNASKGLDRGIVFFQAVRAVAIAIEGGQTIRCPGGEFVRRKLTIAVRIRFPKPCDGINAARSGNNQLRHFTCFTIQHLYVQTVFNSIGLRDSGNLSRRKGARSSDPLDAITWGSSRPDVASKPGATSVCCSYGGGSPPGTTTAWNRR